MDEESSDIRRKQVTCPMQQMQAKSKLSWLRKRTGRVVSHPHQVADELPNHRSSVSRDKSKRAKLHCHTVFATRNQETVGGTLETGLFGGGTRSMRRQN